SHPVDLAGLVPDDVPHAPAVHPAGGGAATAVPEGWRAAPRLRVVVGDGWAAAARQGGVRVPRRGPGRGEARSGAGRGTSGHGRRSPGQPRPWRRAGWAPAATRSATAARGSRPVTRDSPTRTASAPALAYAIRSCGPRTPDSATLTMWSGISGPTRSKVERSTLRSFRL